MKMFPLNVIPAEAIVRLRMIWGIQKDAICYAVSAKGASPHRMRPSKSLFSKESPLWSSQ
jgi:hypothetical protein